ncbi:MAG: cysteine desulfurase NifS [Elusimicrobiota bacterium]|nr:cysteine desulfurase NifS [Elusimicrobiota bacterium]MDH5661620.1 cysteine desulfurase NifS [Elusimicrobiota bacterium]
MRRIYLDHAATTPVHPRVAEAMAPYFSKDFGNPSTLYSYGREAKGALEKARAKVARLIGAKQPEEIVFTSGGTEADNFALCGIAWANQEKGNHIITTSIEHHAVINICKFLEKRGFKVTYLPVDKDGLVDTMEVKRAITEGTILVSVMHANNEIGTVEPIEEIAEIVKEKGIYFHTDAVQTLGHLPLNVDKMKVDLLAISAHKLYGPKGVGALYLRRGTKIVPFLYGGEQENKRRASTENVAGIVGFGEACSLAEKDMAEEEKRLTYLRDKFIEGILKGIKHSRLNGHPKKRLPGNVNVSVEGVEGESMLLNLDLAGVCASSGSACTSSILEPSHVLTAIGISPEVAHSSLRFTLGRENNEEDVNYVLKVLPGIVEKLRSMSPIYQKEK